MRTYRVVMLDGSEGVARVSVYPQLLAACEGLYQLLGTQPCLYVTEVFDGLPPKMQTLPRYYLNTAQGKLRFRYACLEAYIKDQKNA